MKNLQSICKALVHQKLEDCSHNNKENRKLEYFQSFSLTHGLGLSEITFSDLCLLFILLKRFKTNINEKEKLLQLERIYFQAKPVSFYKIKWQKKNVSGKLKSEIHPHCKILKLLTQLNGDNCIYFL